MNEQKPYIITIVGPESSGKTTLARQLAVGYGCPWVPEFAREYLEGLGREYNEADMSMIAEGQLTAINEKLAVSSEQLSVGKSQAAVRSCQSEVLPPDFLKEGFYSESILVFQRESFGDEPRPIVIIDSGMMSIRMWAKIKYNMTIPLVEKAMEEDMTSMYILCRSVWSWEADPLREAPLLLDRVWLYNHFLKELFLTQSK